MRGTYAITCGPLSLAIADVHDRYVPAGQLAVHGALITRLNVPLAYREQGVGTRLLEQIFADADREGVTLFLAASSYGEWSNERLKAWYRKRGFKTLRTGYMVRYPQKQENVA